MTAKNPAPGKLAYRFTLQIMTTCPCDDEHLHEVSGEPWISKCTKCGQTSVIGHVSQYDQLIELEIAVEQLRKELQP